MKIVFMGTPEFALPTLEALCERHEVTAVFTAPDKPRGRKMVFCSTPVGEWAEAHGIPVYKPETLKDNAAAPVLDAVKPDAVVVVAYGKLLPAYVLSCARYGCINVHGSLLPAYRGAAPMQRAIMDGVDEIGVTVMQMDAGLDTGDMLLPASIPLGVNDDFEYVHDTLAALGADALIRALDALENGTVVPRKQDDALSCYAPKIEKSDCLLDFSLPAKKLHDTVRALSPVPLAFTFLGGRMIKIARTRLKGESSDKPAGTVVSCRDSIDIVCGDGAVLAVLELVPEGKRRMDALSFINGRGVCPGDSFSAQK